MGLILWVVFGALAGWVASMIMKTNAEQSTLTDIGVGIVGAIVGGWLMSAVGGTGIQGFNLYSFLVAVLGACLFIAAVKALRRV